MKLPTTADLRASWQHRKGDPALVYMAAFVVIGLAATLLGPAIPKLQETTGSSEAEISILFVIPSPFLVLGSFLAGRLYDRGGGHRVMAAGVACVGAGALLIPFVMSSLALLALGFSVIGLGMAFVDVGCNTLLVWSRTGPVGAIMNALHLCFAIGALIGPVTVGLSEWLLDDISLACGLVVLTSAVVAIGSLKRPSPVPRAAGQNRSTENGSSRTHWGPMTLIAVFFALYVGLELGFAGWIAKYAEQTGLGDAPIPALTAAAFWGGFMLCRVASIGFARRVAPDRVLLVACSLAVLVAASMVFVTGVAAVVWIASFLFGAAVAPQYPTMVALAEERVGLSGGATSMITGASSLGGLALPWIIGQMLDARGAQAMPQVILVTAVLLLGWFVVVDRRTR